MEERDIDYLMNKGWWLSVSPVGTSKSSNSKESSWKWTCAIYKRFNKSGNWVTESCQTFDTPTLAYEWALEYLQIRADESVVEDAKQKACTENNG